MARPLLLVVDPDLDALARTEGELARRFGADFRVRGESDSRVALDLLRLAADRGDPVALVLADKGEPVEAYVLRALPDGSPRPLT
ncbi:MAG: hypothetical protein ACKOVB_21890 [Terrabacter sp.]